jgi:hypothetical protein
MQLNLKIVCFDASFGVSLYARQDNQLPFRVSGLTYDERLLCIFIMVLSAIAGAVTCHQRLVYGRGRLKMSLYKTGA